MCYALFSPCSDQELISVVGSSVGYLRTRARPGTWGRKAAQTIPSCQQFPCALSLLTAAANMGAQLLPWQPSSHWLPIPSAGLVTSQQTPSVDPPRCQLQMAPMTPFDTIIWPIFPKNNRPMSRPQKSTPGPNRDSKVPS